MAKRKTRKSPTPVKPNAKKPRSGRVYSTYDQEYQSQPKQVKKRVTRNKDRRKALREGRVQKGDGKDVHHPNGASSGGKTKVTTAKKNRAEK
jgi:hypothetical protein